MKEGTNTSNLEANGQDFVVESYDPDFGLRVSTKLRASFQAYSSGIQQTKLIPMKISPALIIVCLK